MLIATDLQPELPRIACPVLVTAGTLDRVRPPHLVEPVARAIPGARYACSRRGTTRRCKLPSSTPGRSASFLMPLERKRSYSVACVPRMTVAWDDKTPPLPCANATSQSFT